MLEPPVARRLPFPGVGQAVLLVLLLGTLLFVFGLIVLFAFGVSLDPSMDTFSSPAATSFLLILGNTLGFAVVTFVGWKLARAPARQVFPFRRFHPGLLLPIAVASVGAVLMGSQLDNLVRLIPLPEALDLLMKDLEETLMGMFQEAFWPSLVAVVVVAPLTEELFFRGLLLHGFLGRFRPWSAVVLASFFFALAHGTPNQLIVGMGAGIFLGWLFIRSRNLWLPVCAHGFFNAQPALAARWAGPVVAPQEPTFEPGLLALGAAIFILGVLAFRRFCPIQRPAPAIPSAVAAPPQEP